MEFEFLFAVLSDARRIYMNMYVYIFATFPALGNRELFSTGGVPLLPFRHNAAAPDDPVRHHHRVRNFENTAAADQEPIKHSSVSI